MKYRAFTLRLLLLAATSLLTDCSTQAAKTAVKPTAKAKSMAASSKGKATDKMLAVKDDELDEYATAPDISDPLEKLNRGTFWVNDQLYTFIFRPISKGYQLILPRPVRKGIDNAFENVKYPVRVVNCTLQGKFKRAGQETGKFVVNTVGGVGGIFRPAQRIPALANLPEEDTAQTFGKWGIPNGPYLVLPFLGPSSVRDGVGLVGDYVLNPVNWPYFRWHGSRTNHDWVIVPPLANTLRSTPAQMELYDTITKDAVDTYLSARSAYSQNRAEAIKK
ncbi:VacJ family lipoprotein [Prosthecobacter sp.]|uniref:MlaA family lipoprotein n=1 Tax=Prosthecobacter sp. TaxID=1965333 RepID=UPI00248A772A|nr:VacJ family lipoprotein [Prosthecobacter sp.]MDI1312169.1 VacJ family lipoprotein [Prosthecobacter sp.]